MIMRHTPKHNMRFLRLAALLLALTAGTSSNLLRGKTVIQEGMYMFGFAASFNDSIVYFTELQQLDTVWVDSKSDFLLGRENYSYQLRNYLRDSIQSPHRTCIVVFSPEKKKIDKKLQKFKKIYATQGNGNYDVRYIPKSEFSFTMVDMSDPSLELTEEEIEARKKAKKQRESRSKGGQGAPPDGGGGMGGQGGPPGGGMGGGMGGGR